MILFIYAFFPHIVSQNVNDKFEKILEYQVLKPFKACNVLWKTSTSFIIWYLWLKWLQQLKFQHFFNFVGHIVGHNVKDKSLNEEAWSAKILLELDTPAYSYIEVRHH